MNKNNNNDNKISDYIVFEDIKIYHTMLRNIGLYISLSIGILGYMKHYINFFKENTMYKYIIFLISNITLLISFLINLKLILDVHKLEYNTYMKNYHIWYVIPYITLSIIILLFILGTSLIYKIKN